MNRHPQFEEDFDLYALGALEGEEKQALETHFTTCAECQQKVQEARGRLAALSFAAPPFAPPAEARERLLRKVRAAAPQRQQPSGFSRLWRWMAPALIGALALACLLLLVDLKTRQNENTALTAQMAELRAAAQIQEEKYQHARAVQDLLTAPDTLRVTLVSGSVKPVPEGRAFYHPQKGLVFYTANLPKLPTDRTYQLWLVPTKGNPISAGVFAIDANGNGAVVLPPLPHGITAKAFAVTEEPAGGVPQPTGPKVLVGLVS